MLDQADAAGLRGQRAEVGGRGERDAGSSAIMTSRPLAYGSQTAVQPSALAETYDSPCMNCALTCCPVAVVNGRAR